MESLFCKNTGSYLAQTADFCSHFGLPKPPFKIVLPSKPMNIDALSWVEECPRDMSVRLHPDAEVRRNVRSILNRKNRSVSLLINRKAGCFAELDYVPEEMCFSGGMGSLAIGLIRHKLLESDRRESLYSHKNANIFMLEEGCEFLKVDAGYVIRNRFSGRAFYIDNISQFPKSGEKLALENKTDDFKLFQNFCLAGILRQVLPSHEVMI